jgi:PTH1 family peptidyl-tRNA hydrolase
VWLVAGLGNPGPKYERSPHNMGFRVVDELSRRYRIDAFKEKTGGLVASGSINGTRTILLKPMQYMNLSGHAVQRTAAFHKVEPANILVVHDEIDFDFGRVKVKPDGGHGGHNGLRSIIQQLGSNAFPRVRVGVGRPEREQGPDVKDFLLSDFPASMEREVEDLTDRAADAVETVLRDGVRSAMNQLNGNND